MRRRHHEEEHLNHEAWAIPYGDLVTLLLAFFVVMYAVSSVNAGKYRVMADALSDAFGGPPRTLSPVQLGESQHRAATPAKAVLTSGAATPLQVVGVQRAAEALLPRAPAGDPAARQLNAIGTQVEQALAGLVDQRLVTVRRGPTYLEVEIQSDLLFASGSALPSAAAVDAISRLGAVLRAQPNPVRVEGYTDDQPIRTFQFQSNWELSAARAASVVHVLADRGVAPGRMAVIGYGEFQPRGDNATPAGRNANRRVQLVILAAPQADDTRSRPLVADGAPIPTTSTTASVGAASGLAPTTAGAP